MSKEVKKPIEKKVHKITMKKEPLWFSMNIAGKYEGIKYRFTYREYYNEEIDDVAHSFQFSWPGRIPEDKVLAEKGISALFMKTMETGGIITKVIPDNYDNTSNEEEEKALLNELNDAADQQENL